MSEIPSELYYTSEHEWVQRTGENTVRVGITDYAQSALGDVVFVQLPEIDAEVTAGESFGEVESTKSVSDLYAPVTAKVIAVNENLESSPDLVNADPYGEGWMIELQADPGYLDEALDELLDADAYRETISE
ncbi:glycine cleavage system protein GcvH [uncultured Mycolicibacterium sp.]|uniref:glycine cleavage system protein GcvH n=1 Tax=uncultured Mycolicibacterium sp. TaxID=2320817 RepID=UPI00260B13BA|nr:glycine cleavage system protein GcvH [uncultured Mycolicibacterium sp.]